MATFELPYGREAIRLTVDDGHLAGVLRSGIHEYRPADDPWTIVRKSMENPIGSPRLRELAKGKRRVTVIASDHTRPVPSRVIMPQMRMVFGWLRAVSQFCIQPIMMRRPSGASNVWGA